MRLSQIIVLCGSRLTNCSHKQWLSTLGHARLDIMSSPPAICLHARGLMASRMDNPTKWLWSTTPESTTSTTCTRHDYRQVSSYLSCKTKECCHERLGGFWYVNHVNLEYSPASQQSELRSPSLVGISFGCFLSVICLGQICHPCHMQRLLRKDGAQPLQSGVHWIVQLVFNLLFHLMFSTLQL